MFICEDCRCEHEFAFSGSYGPCEMCGITKNCMDVRNYCIDRKCKGKKRDANGKEQDSTESSTSSG